MPLPVYRKLQFIRLWRPLAANALVLELSLTSIYIIYLPSCCYLPTYTALLYYIFQDTVLPEAVNYWSKALRVRRTENIIRLSRKCQQNQVFFKVYVYAIISYNKQFSVTF